MNSEACIHPEYWVPAHPSEDPAKPNPPVGYSDNIEFLSVRGVCQLRVKKYQVIDRDIIKKLALGSMTSIPDTPKILGKSISVRELDIILKNILPNMKSDAYCVPSVVGGYEK